MFSVQITESANHSAGRIHHTCVAIELFNAVRIFDDIGTWKMVELFR